MTTIPQCSVQGVQLQQFIGARRGQVGQDAMDVFGLLRNWQNTGNLLQFAIENCHRNSGFTHSKW
jgi:hypothetical protein